MRKPVATLIIFLIASALPGMALAELCDEQGCCTARAPMPEMDCCSVEQAPRAPSHEVVVPDLVKPVKKLDLAQVAIPQPAFTLADRPEAGRVEIETSPPTPRDYLTILTVLLI
ncbi:MAG TPA: hypothetical protein VM534_05460 [Thermoanaerobaculia bacterium]|nr:hypothetical protein [Thermoanaerobaculia bacterium]